MSIRKDYSNTTRAELIERVHELEELTHRLIAEHESENKLHRVEGGAFAHWYWNPKSDSVRFGPALLEQLGYAGVESPEHVTLGGLTAYLHPDDLTHTLESLTSHLQGEIPVVETEFRLQDSGGRWHWFHSRAAVTQRGRDGGPELVSGILLDITERKLEERDLKQRVTIDELTGIANHRELVSRLIGNLDGAERTGQPVAVALFDIDNFKRVNDTYGHVAGDAVLAEVGSIFTSHVREGDLAGRYGGEEFLVILPNTSTEQAVAVSERIRLAIEAHTFPGDIRITISAGVAVAHGGAHTDLVSVADGRLYAAKRAGKNRVVAE